MIFSRSPSRSMTKAESVDAAVPALSIARALFYSNSAPSPMCRVTTRNHWLLHDWLLAAGAVLL
jgi:hypothetical protein